MTALAPLRIELVRTGSGDLTLRTVRFGPALVTPPNGKPASALAVLLLRTAAWSLREGVRVEPPKLISRDKGSAAASLATTRNNASSGKTWIQPIATRLHASKKPPYAVWVESADRQTFEVLAPSQSDPSLLVEVTSPDDLDALAEELELRYRSPSDPKWCTPGVTTRLSVPVEHSSPATPPAAIGASAGNTDELTAIARDLLPYLRFVVSEPWDPLGFLNRGAAAIERLYADLHTRVLVERAPFRGRDSMECAALEHPSRTSGGTAVDLHGAGAPGKAARSQSLRHGERATLEDLLVASGDAEPPRRSWIVLGSPGAGKSTLLQHFAYWQARAFLSLLPGEREADGHIPRWIPIVVPLRELPTTADTPHDCILAWLRDPTRKHAASGLIQRFDELRERGLLALLFDGLDEVPRASASSDHPLKGFLVGAQHSCGHVPLVVTSRVIGYDESLDAAGVFAKAEILPLGDEEQLKLLDGALDGRPAHGKSPEQWLAHLHDHPRLSAERGNPMWLTLFAERLRAPRLDNDSPTPGKLYVDAIEQVLEARHRRGESPVSNLDAALEGLQRLSLGEPRVGDFGVEVSAAKTYFTPAPVLDEIREAGVLVVVTKGRRRDGADTRIKTTHRAFQEALAARELQKLHAENPAAIRERVKAYSAEDVRLWAEPVARMTDWMTRETANVWIRDLASIQPEIAARAAGSCDFLEHATIEALLQAGRDDFEKRRQAVQRILDRIGSQEPRERADTLSFLRTLVATTQAASDLLIVDQVLELMNARTERVQVLSLRPAPAAPVSCRAELEKTLDALAAAGDYVRDHILGMWWRRVPAGKYWIGDLNGKGVNSEKPAHLVELSEFWISALAVTNAQMRAFDSAFSPYEFEHWSNADRELIDDQPAVRVDWYTAMAFARWIGAHACRSVGSLPTEAQWEVACRGLAPAADAAGLKRYLASEKRAKWPWSSGPTKTELGAAAWYGEGWQKGTTHAVGQKKPNPLGLFDMHGNSWEWCTDWYGEYSSDRQVDPAGPAGGSVRVFRGGSFWDVADVCRSAFRVRDRPSVRRFDLGFRVALPAAPSSR